MLHDEIASPTGARSLPFPTPSHAQRSTDIWILPRHPTIERLPVLLLHIDEPGASPRHTVALAHEPGDASSTGTDVLLGQPLAEWPELRITRIWRDATRTFAIRATHYRGGCGRLCPICAPGAERRCRLRYSDIP